MRNLFLIKINIKRVGIFPLSKLPAVCSINIEFCSAQAKTFMILCKLTVRLISILLFIAFLLVDYNIWYCVVCDYRGTTPRSSTIYIYQKSEFLKLIIIRIICEF